MKLAFLTGSRGGWGSPALSFLSYLRKSNVATELGLRVGGSDEIERGILILRRALTEGYIEVGQAIYTL